MDLCNASSREEGCSKRSGTAGEPFEMVQIGTNASTARHSRKLVPFTENGTEGCSTEMHPPLWWPYREKLFGARCWFQVRPLEKACRVLLFACTLWRLHLLHVTPPVVLLSGFLDPEKKLFSHRILSRDECIDPYSKTGNLR